MKTENPTSRISTISFVFLCGTIIFTTLAYGAVHQPIITLFYLVVTTLAILWSANSFLTGTLWFSRSPLQLPLLLLGIYGLIQVIPFGYTTDPNSGIVIGRTISIEPFATLSTAVHILALCAFIGAVLIYTDRESRMRQLVTLITVFGFIYAFFAIIQSVLSPNKIYGIYEPAFAVPFGSFVNRHNFAAIIEMTIALPLALIFTGAVDKDKRLLYWVAVALMATALLLSGSRGGLVALLAGLVFLAMLTIRQIGRSHAFLSVSLAVALVFIAMAGAVFVGGDTSLTRFSDAAAGDNISSSRTYIWGTSLKIISEHFPLGAGLGAFPQAYTRFDTTGGAHRVDQAHNDFLQIVADAGVVGVILGAIFIFLLFREGLRNVKGQNKFRRGVAVGAFTGCFTILVHSLFDFVLHITAVSVMFLTLLALLVASGRRFDDDVMEDEDRSHSKKAATVTDLSERSSAAPTKRSRFPEPQA
jgi:O-antigen ligase